MKNDELFMVTTVVVLVLNRYLTDFLMAGFCCSFYLSSVHFCLAQIRLRRSEANTMKITNHESLKNKSLIYTKI